MQRSVSVSASQKTQKNGGNYGAFFARLEMIIKFSLGMVDLGLDSSGMKVKS